MEINLIRLKNDVLSIKDIEIDNEYIRDLNDALFDNDIIIKEKSKDKLISIYFIESDGVLAKIPYQIKKMSSPVILLAGKHSSAYKGMMEVNTRLIMAGLHTMPLNGDEAQNASLLSEITRVYYGMDKLKENNFAIISSSKNGLIDRKKEDAFISKFGLCVTRFTFESFMDIEVDEKEDIPHHNYYESIIDIEEMETLTLIYNKIRNLIKIYGFTGIAFEEEDFNYYFELLSPLFNERGITFIVGNDIYSLFSSNLLYNLNDSYSIYGNISKIDISKSNLYLRSYNVPLVPRKEDGSINNGKVTLAKFTYDNKTVVVFEGKITSSKKVNNREIEIEINIEEHLPFDLVRETIGSSLAMVYGECVGNVLAYDNIVYMNK